MSEQKPTPYKTCKTCGVVMEKKPRPEGRLESNSDFLKRKYCSPECNPHRNGTGESNDDAGAYLPTLE